MREWFEYGLSVLDALRESSPIKQGAEHPLNVAFKAAAIDAAGGDAAVAAYRKKHRGKRVRELNDFGVAQLILTDAQLEEIRKPFKEKADALLEEHDAKVKEIEEKLCELAPHAELRTGPPRRYCWIYGTSTQGFGNRRYTIAAAEMHADQCRFYDIEVEVRPDETERPKGLEHPECWTPSYTVFAAVESETDVEILKRRPGPSLKEWIRMCWKRGVNPRVYNPFLPHGIEEELGLDYFGNEKGG